MNYKSNINEALLFENIPQWISVISVCDDSMDQVQTTTQKLVQSENENNLLYKQKKHKFI